MNTLFNGKSAAMMLALSLMNVSAAFAQDDNANAKEERGSCGFQRCGFWNPIPSRRGTWRLVNSR